ncbi:MAG: glycosyltransferase [Candidatus Nanopelagicales bacterium]
MSSGGWPRIRAYLGRLPSTTSARRIAGRATRSVRRARLRSSAGLLRGTGLVQSDWYLGQAPVRSGDAATDWLLRGRLEGRSPNPLFEAQWFDPDGWDGRSDPLLRLARHGDSPHGTHPLLDPRQPLGPFLAQVDDADLLPLPAESLIPPTTWGEWKQLLGGAQDVLDREVARASARTTTVWDGERDAAYVRRWTELPVPPAAEPIVSVVMPVRDRPELVARAIDSVRAQSFSHWELLVVDDGSTDRTPDVVAAIAAQDPRVRLLRRPASGVCAARNAGIAAATGQYVAFLDSDNEWTPDFLMVCSAVMRSEGLRSAFAVTEEQSDTSKRYRDFAGDVEDMRTGNFVDLNVLVVERSLLDEVGGFDESLRRMVDYDLAWRIAERDRLTLLPFIGVRYRASATATDRISVRESLAWDDVVKARRLIDWQTLHDGLPARRPDLLSIIVAVRDDWRAARDTVRATLELPAPDGLCVEVVVVDNASSRGAWRLLWALFGQEPGVRIVRSPVNLHRAAATSLGFADSEGQLIVVLPAGTIPGSDWTSLTAALQDGAVVVLRDGSDDRRCPSSGPDVLATTASCFLRMHGLDPLFVNEFEIADFVARVASQDLGPVVSLVGQQTREKRPYERPTGNQHADNVREWQRRWPATSVPTARFKT